MEKRSLMDNLDIVMLALEEICDNGYIQIIMISLLTADPLINLAELSGLSSSQTQLQFHTGWPSVMMTFLLESRQWHK